jgi:hypothetical protein
MIRGFREELADPALQTALAGEHQSVDRMEIEELDQGLNLLGWRADVRATSEDQSSLEPIAQAAIDLHAAGELTNEIRNDLALRAFRLLEFRLTNTQERALMTGVVYRQSKFLGPSVPLVDEAVLCYYRGYYVASLALLFVVTEQALLRMAGWKQGTRKPSFPKLKDAVKTLPSSETAAEAAEILDVVYGQYTQPSDSPVGFNRHAVHHGLRDFTALDKMNCVRAFLLLDALAAAEGLSKSVWEDGFDEVAKRQDAYEKVVSLGTEMKLIRPGDERLPDEK